MAQVSQTPDADLTNPAAQKGFGRPYWMCNSIEMFERLAFFGVRAVVPIYIMQATEPGGLHLTAIHKGWIYMWWAVLQSWLPMFTGGIADRYGYKRILYGAVSANVVGYLLMAFLHSYYGFFAGILVLATGTAFFKPALQGSIAQNLTKENSSMGWGLFYWVVNVGAFGAPILATIILGKPHSAQGWQVLFIASAVFTSFNLLLLFTFKDVSSGADKTQNMAEVFALTIENIWPYWLRGGKFHPARVGFGILLAVCGLGVIILVDGYWYVGVAMFLLGGAVATWLVGGTFTWQLRLPVFLGIMSCFWLMMYQLWDLHPNFIEDWIDSSMVAEHVPTNSWREYGDRGLVRVPQQILLNLNAALIILCIVPISWLVRKMRTLSSMLIGMSVATVGVLVAGLTGNGWFFLLGVVFFSLGEMLTGPKKNEYLGLIAPKGKKGLYLGYVNIPIGIGVGIGSMIAGIMYDNYGEKATLALKYMAENPASIARAAQSSDWSNALEKVPGVLGIDRDEAFETVRDEAGMTSEEMERMLLSSFEHDWGQIQNLAMLELALHGAADSEEDFTKKVKDWFMAAHAPKLDEAGQEAAYSLTRGAKLADIGLGRFVHHLADALGRSSIEAFALIHGTAQDKEVADRLWTRFGHDPAVLDNLALEYLAQGTSRLHDTVRDKPFNDPEADLHARIGELKQRLGIGRMKAFKAMNVATGADDAQIDKTLAAIDIDVPEDRVYTYLIQLPHIRFSAVAGRDWSTDRNLLRELVYDDAEAIKIVKAGIDKDDFTEKVIALAKRTFGSEIAKDDDNPEGVDYARLAGKNELIVKAMSAKDWTRSTHLTSRVLRLNPFEARALASAEMNKSPLANTHLLWEQYNPQYWVWLPFAGIGVIAMICLAIFGQKAKQWKDMNA